MYKEPGFVLKGVFHPCANGKETFVNALRALCQLDPALAPKLASLAPHLARSRRIVEASSSAVYPKRPDLNHEVVEFTPGWFVGTNESHQRKLEILMIALACSRLKYGEDFRTPCLEGNTEDSPLPEVRDSLRLA